MSNTVLHDEDFADDVIGGTPHFGDDEAPLHAVPLSFEGTRADVAEAILERIIETKGGSRREPQVRLARTVTTAIASRRAACIEAGTGTGKSIGYISGALASGEQVIVAPHTKALQDQLRADLELVIEALPDGGGILDKAPSYAIVKGRKAYLCLNKIKAPVEQEPGSDQQALEGLDTPPVDRQGEEVPATSELGKEYAALVDWADHTSTGDRADLDFKVSSKAWDLVSVTSDDCLGKDCPLYEACFAEQARRAAETANIIVTNQAYLAMGMKMPNLLPAGVGGVVIDEAHEFPHVVADTFGAEVTSDRLRNLAKVTKTALKPLTKSEVKGKKSSMGEKVDGLVKEMTKVADALDTAMKPPREADRNLIVKPAVRKAFEDAQGIIERFKRLVGLMPVTNERDKGQRERALRPLTNAYEDLRVLLDTEDRDQVAWVETQRGKAVARSARFDTSGVVEERLVRRFPGTVFTSATLTVEQKFDSIAQRFGLPLHQERIAAGEAWSSWKKTAEDPKFWIEEQVGSPFNYDMQGMLHFAPDMPNPSPPRFVNGKRVEPDLEEYPRAVADLTERVVRAAGGRTLVLCTSWKTVNIVAEHLQDVLGDEYPVYAQTPGEPSAEIARKFAADPRSVLVGTRTFWTGVSVEGSTCNAVIIDKMPFPSPSDPVVAARTERADEGGKGKGFREVSLADGCLTVIQGAGRLIRTVNDRGAVIICDPRLNPASPLKKSYASTVMRSLPPFRVVQDHEKVLAALGRLDAAAREVESKDPAEAAGEVHVETEEANDDE